MVTARRVMPNAEQETGQPVKMQAACPRCGYDQRGVIAAWREQCPLTGTCTECGLELRWAEIIAPAKFEPRWCVEFASSWLSVPRACVTTFLRSFRPWLFWSRLRMAQRIRRRRLALYILFLMTPLLFGYVVVQGTVATLVRRQLQSELLAQQQQLPSTLAQTQNMLSQIESGRVNWSASAEQVAQWKANVKMQIAVLQLQIATPVVIDHSYLEALVEAIVLPISSSSWGSIRWGDGTIAPYPAPLALHQTWNVQSVLSTEVMLHHGISAMTLVVLLVLLPASFILLPVSRRRAKVRWGHISRVTVYSMWIPAVLLALAVVGTAWLMLDQNSAMADWLGQNALLCGWILIPLWWAAAIRNYLRMPHAAAVACMLTIMLALLCSPCLAIVLPQQLVRMIVS